MNGQFESKITFYLVALLDERSLMRSLINYLFSNSPESVFLSTRTQLIENKMQDDGGYFSTINLTQ